MYSKLLSPAYKTGSRGMLRMHLQRSLKHRSAKNTLMQKDIEDLKSQDDISNMAKIKIKKVIKKQLILPEDDQSAYNKNIAITPSDICNATDDKGQGVESNKDIGHAMSFEDV